MPQAPELDALDRRIVNRLQAGLPVVERPFASVADELGVSEAELLARLRRLSEAGLVDRVGPLYRADALGGDVTLAAMQVPPERLDAVAGRVNAFPEVAHNYERDHSFNLWFVVAVERPEEIGRVLGAIERETGLRVYDFPKVREFCLGLRLEV